VTTGAANFRKQPFSVQNGRLQYRIVWNHPPWNGHSRLEQRSRRNIRPREFVDEPIAVLIRARAYALLRLHAVVVVERVVSELANRNDVPHLMPRLKNQSRRITRVARAKGLRRKPRYTGGIPLSA